MAAVSLVPTVGYIDKRDVPPQGGAAKAMNEFDALRELLWMLVTNAGTGMLIALLLVAAAIDWRTHRIPNWLTVAGMLYGLLYGATHATSVGAGLLQAFSGLALGLVLLLPLWLMRIMGAGDVKLMAGVGAFVGPLAIVLVVPIVFIVGGVFALLHTARRGALRRLAANLRFIGMTFVMPGIPWRGTVEATTSNSVGRLPYAVSICVGTVAFLVARQLGFL